MDYESKQFYDAESASYSQKRYDGPLQTYSQHLFRKRLDIFLGMLGRILRDAKISLLEIGCADGIILKKIISHYSGSVERMMGLDISPMMVETAREKNTDPRLTFYLRGEEEKEKYDVVIELGVHVADFEEEIRYVKSYLKDDGHFIFSVAGWGSSHARLKLSGAPYRNDYKNYPEAEKILGRHFEIVAAEPYGLFIPKLWAFPAVARVIQPAIEAILWPILPSLFHEKLYLLRNKRD